MTMNDEDIKKALEYCFNGECEFCPYRGDKFFCFDKVKEEALALIDRLQAENKKLQAEIKGFDDFLKETDCSLKEIKDNAIKEFAEKLKKRQRTFIDEEYAYEFIPSIEIDVLLAEKVGEQNA